MQPVAILFARSDSVYKTLAGCDVYDMEREATPIDLAKWLVEVARRCASYGR